MGYTTDFTGLFNLDKPLTDNHRTYLRSFSNSRRMSRDVAFLEARFNEDTGDVRGYADPVMRAAGLDLGPEGAYYTNEKNWADKSILNPNVPPIGQPGLWCNWCPTQDGTAIVWNGAEKFYNYVEWLQYLITHFLAPWGYKLNGEVQWQGESNGDVGTIQVTNNTVVSVRKYL